MDTDFEQEGTLVNWDAIGVAEPAGNGNFDFEDDEAAELPARYYRVVTQ